MTTGGRRRVVGSSSRSSTLPAMRPSAIDDLMVEEVQPGAQLAVGRRSVHEPAFVTIISGMVASGHDHDDDEVEADAIALPNRPFTLSPM